MPAPLQVLTLEEFESRRAEYDAAVAATPGIMRFCSGSDWLLAAHRDLYPERETLICRREEAWLVWAVGRLYQFQTVLQPLEADWFFGSPVIGPEPGVAARLLLDVLLRHRERFPLVWIGGVPVRERLFGLVLSNFRQAFKAYHIPGCDCHVASLEGGLGGYLQRRSARFRQTLRRVEGRAEREGVDIKRFRGVVDAGRFLKRVLAIEGRSWKGDASESIFEQERFRRFYRTLIESLSGQDRFRAVILRRGGEDIAYVMGGLFAGEYRGFQMSYDQAFRELSPGHLSQLEMLRMLGEEGIERYDLGMAMDYKERWADGLHEIANLLLMAK